MGYTRAIVAHHKVSRTRMSTVKPLHSVRLRADVDPHRWRASILRNGWFRMPENYLTGVARELNVEAWRAVALLATCFRETPLMFSSWLSEEAGIPVYVKLESEQITGSFKARGACNRVLSSSSQRKRIVTASTGNHAMAVLHAYSVLSPTDPQAEPPIIFVPDTISPAKAERLRRLGAELVKEGASSLEAEEKAMEYAREHGMEYMSPYNDPRVAGGQGTVAIEILASLPSCQLDVFVPVGGGGLVSGIASVLAEYSSREAAPGAAIGDKAGCPRVFGCEPAASDAMRRIVLGLPAIRYTQETLSDGTAGGVEEGSLTIEVCRNHVRKWVAVRENDIAHAMRGMLDNEGKVVEGAAGVAVAGLLHAASAGKLTGDAAVVVICGGNVGRRTLRKVLG